MSGLQKEVLYTKEGDEVKFDVNTSLDYLKTLKDKKTYKEVMKENSGATVMAIQILLKNKGFNVGKIDGILKSQGKVTSNTMEAIKEFQRQNGLTDDGAPGPNTIRKLLEVYGNEGGNEGENGGENGGENEGENEQVDEDEQVKDLAEEEYIYGLCEKTSLTDDEVKQLVEYVIKYGEDGLRMDIEILTDKQAEYLSRMKTLHLEKLTSITDVQAESLSKVNSLYLDCLTSITDVQVESLSMVKDDLSLESLTSITDAHAESLSKIGGWLSLNGLTSITDAQAESLSKIEYLGIYGLTSITDTQAQSLAKVKSLYINESILSPRQKQILGIN